MNQLDIGLILLLGMLSVLAFERVRKINTNFGLELRLYILPLFALWAVWGFLMGTCWIPSGSMEPTLRIGDVALVQKWGYGWFNPWNQTRYLNWRKPSRGDVIVFRSPVTGVYFTKRIIGMPGDRLDYVDHQLTINGTTVVKQPSTTALNARVVWTEELPSVLKPYEIAQRPVSHADVMNITVPPGHYWVLGDNRDNSEDSRSWGFLPEQAIEGIVWRVLFSVDWPGLRWNRMGFLVTPLMSLWAEGQAWCLSAVMIAVLVGVWLKDWKH